MITIKKLLDGKCGIITGGNSGIGEAAAKRFAEEGAKLVLAARRADKLEKVVEEIRNMGGEAYAFSCDVCDEDQVKAVVWLCSDQARMITGVSLPVDGGYVLGK